MTTFIKSLLITLALAGFGFSGSAMAQAPTFESVDTNQDGSISAEEAEAVEGLDLDAADTDGDGSLSQEEYAKATAG